MVHVNMNPQLLTGEEIESVAAVPENGRAHSTARISRPGLPERLAIAGSIHANLVVARRRSSYCPPTAVVSAGAGISIIGTSELNVSTATFHVPSACFFQIVVNLPLSVIVDPSGIDI